MTPLTCHPASLHGCRCLVQAGDVRWQGQGHAAPCSNWRRQQCFVSRWRLVEIKAGIKGRLRQAGMPWQMPPITENWLQLGLLPLRAAWLPPACSRGAFPTAGVSAAHRARGRAQRTPRVCTDPNSGFSVDSCWPRDKQKGSLGMFSGQRGSGGPGESAGRETELWRPVRER